MTLITPSATPFNSYSGPIVIPVRIYGPTGDEFARMAVDTGAAFSLIRPDILQRIGCNLSSIAAVQNMMTVSGYATAPSLLVDRIEALGRVYPLFAIAAHALPPTAVVDGLLGLNFFRGLDLNISFRTGQITLT